MIDNALTTIISELNDFLKIKFNISEDMVILSNIVDASGSPILKGDNKILCSLINITEEKQLQKASPNSKNSPIYLSIFILFSSAFDDKLKTESLKFISAIIAFFQRKKSFNNSNSPDLNSNIDKLSVQINNLNYDELSNVFSCLGGKYTASISYKISMLAIEEELMQYPKPDLEGRTTDLGNI